MKHIETLWNDYLAVVLPKDAGLTQVIETRRAFYAGAAAIFGHITGMMDGTTPEPTEADLKVMEDISVEIQEFMSSTAAEARCLKGVSHC